MIAGRQRSVLITGGRGMLATDLTATFQAAGWKVTAPGSADLDVADEDHVRENVASQRPHVVINTACLHVEPSEEDPKRGYRVNAWGPKLLAEACARTGSVMVQISSCGLFGDEVRPYHEYDTVVLKTAYARSKYAGEEYVREAGPRHLVLRLGWLYGGEASHGRNFVAARYREALSSDVMRSAGDKFGSPTYTRDVGQALLRLLDGEAYGVYHVANRGGCSRADYVEAILRASGLDRSVENVDSSHFPRKADVPDCEILVSYNLDFAGVPALPPWEEALERYVRSLDLAAA